LIFGSSKSKSNHIFLDKNTKEFAAHSVNIILSPSFYWTKLQELPVLTVYGAKEYSNSIFEGLLPEGNWTYFVQKEDKNLYRFFAFDQDELLDFITSIGGDKQYVRSIYFAHNEFGDMLDDEQTKFISISDDKCMTKVQNSVVLVPKVMVSDSVDIDDILHKIKLSSNDIKIDTNISINTDIFIVFVVVGLIFSFGFIINIINYNIEIAKLENNITEQIKTLKLPETSFELEAMSAKSSVNIKEQINIRKNIKQISSIKTTQYGKIKKLKITKDKLSVYDK